MKWFRKNTSTTNLVGVAVESDGLTAASVSWVDGVLRIEDLAFLPTAVEPPGAALKHWVDTNGLKGATCFPVLSPAQSSIYQVEKPPVAEDEVEEAARWQVRDSLDFPLAEAVVDTFDVPEDLQRGSQQMLNVIAARKSSVQELVDWVRFAGLEIEAIDIPELVFRNVASMYADEGRPIALFVFDGAAGSIFVFKNDALYLTRKINASVLFEEGEKAAREADLEQLCLEIQRSLDYYESQLNQAPPRRILVYSSSGQHELGDAIATNLNIDVKVLDLSRLGIEVGSREAQFEHRVSSLRAIGAALRQGYA